jgi:hypothetical protein
LAPRKEREKYFKRLPRLLFLFSGYFDEKAMPSAGFVPFLQEPIR